jgi:NADPH2:quinone reductase
MAERAVVRRAQCIAVPDDLDNVTAAAAGNPGMSSWAAMTRRARFVAGESVLINGATGVSGRLAVQVAKYLGARKVIATGRNAASVAGLAALGADATIALDQTPEDLSKAFAWALREGVDVVLDYLWGPSAESLIGAMKGDARVRFVQIGSLAGNAIALPASTLRGSALELMGSGLGSVSTVELLASIGDFLKAVRAGGFAIAGDAVPLAEVEAAWKDSSSAKRTVFVV